MVLKHQDRELLRFEGVEPQGVRVVSLNDAERRFLPLEMKGVASDETLWMWLMRCIVPKHRHYILQKRARVILECSTKADDLLHLSQMSYSVNHVSSGEIRRVGADKNGWWDVLK